MTSEVHWVAQMERSGVRCPSSFTAKNIMISVDAAFLEDFLNFFCDRFSDYCVVRIREMDIVRLSVANQIFPHLTSYVYEMNAESVSDGSCNGIELHLVHPSSMQVPIPEHGKNVSSRY